MTIRYENRWLENSILPSLSETSLGHAVKSMPKQRDLELRERSDDTYDQMFANSWIIILA